MKIYAKDKAFPIVTTFANQNMFVHNLFYKTLIKPMKASPTSLEGEVSLTMASAKVTLGGTMTHIQFLQL